MADIIDLCSELTGWKEIAAYLRVSVRTAQAFEKTRGLPVRRGPGQKGPVFAAPDALKKWRTRFFSRGGPVSSDVSATASEKAWDLYLEGRSLWARRTPEALWKAVECFRQSLKEDSRFVAAHSALAECFVFLALSGQRPSEVMPLAKQHADIANGLDYRNASAHAVRGVVSFAYEWNWEEAETELKLALALDRRSVGVYCWYASYLVGAGRYRDAVIHCRRAQACEAVGSAVTNTHVAKILYVAGDLPGASRLLTRILDEVPGGFLAHVYMGQVLLDMGDAAGALNSLRAADRFAPGNPLVLTSLACTLAAVGAKADASSILEQIIRMTADGYVPACDIAAVYGALGDLDAAFVWLERAYEERAVYLSWLKAWPPFSALRLDARYAVMLSRLRLDK
jgi:tetratricopeptide (TPR) repeat protein